MTRCLGSLKVTMKGYRKKRFQQSKSGNEYENFSD